VLSLSGECHQYYRPKGERTILRSGWLLVLDHTRVLSRAIYHGVPLHVRLGWILLNPRILPTTSAGYKVQFHQRPRMRVIRTDAGAYIMTDDPAAASRTTRTCLSSSLLPSMPSNPLTPTQPNEPPLPQPPATLHVTWVTRIRGH
jgi:hypothetical protein